MTDFYAASGAPSSHAFGFSAQIRAEFSAIATAFGKLPQLTGNALEMLRVNSAGTAVEVVDVATTVAAAGFVTAATVAATYLTSATAAATYQTIAGMSSYLTTATAAAAYLAIGANAVSATKLVTARAINGVNFDGTAAITVADATKAPLTGAGASGTWGINITGNAATATSATDATKLPLAGGNMSGTIGAVDITVSSSIQFPNNIPVYWNDGVAVRRMLLESSTNFHVGDVDNAIAAGQTFFYAKTQMNWLVNAAQKMWLDSTGSVGIGASSAGPKFYVSGSFTNTFSGAAIMARDTGTSTNRIGFAVNATAAYIIAGGSSANPDIVVANNDGSVEIARFLQGGGLTVTIGNVTPGVTNTQTLGSTSLRWSTLNSVLGNFSGLITAAGGVAGALTGNVTGNVSGTAATVTGAAQAAITSLSVGVTDSVSELGYKGLPAASVTTGAFAAADKGHCVYATGGVTAPSGVMSATDVVVILNTTAVTQTITCTATVTIAGTTTSGATRTLAANGIATLVFKSGTTALISGNVT